MTANRLNAQKAGRPKGPRHEAAALTRRFLKHCPEAIDTLLWNMKHSDNPAIQVACAREILDRGLGRPVRSIDRQAGQILDQLIVVSGVPRPQLEEAVEEVVEAAPEPIEIEGELVDDGADQA